jgi:hypothetical protein
MGIRRGRLRFADTKGFAVIVGTQIEAEAEHALCDIAVETDGLAMVVSHILS